MDELKWKKFLLIPTVLLTHLTNEEFYNRTELLKSDDWSQFTLGSNFRKPPIQALTLTTDEKQKERFLKNLNNQGHKFLISGNYSKAHNLFTRDYFANNNQLPNDQILHKLEEKHPTLNTTNFTPEEIHELLNQELSTETDIDELEIIEALDVLVYFRTRPHGITPGMDKFRFEFGPQLCGADKHYQDHSEEKFTDRLAKILTFIQNGKLPHNVLTALRDNEIKGIPPKYRPIGLNSVFRKCVTSLTIRPYFADARSTFHNIQYGLEKNGTDKIIHTIRILKEHDPTLDIFAMDGINAFNSISRLTFLDQLKNWVGQNKLSNLFPFVKQFYGQNSNLWHLYKNDRIDNIQSQEGLQQGDTAGTLLFCCSLHRFSQDLKNILSDHNIDKKSLVLFFIDDGTLIGPHEKILEAIKFIKENGPSIGYNMSLTKGKYLLGQCSDLETATLHKLQLTDLGLNESIIKIHPGNINGEIEKQKANEEYGFDLLGSYIGSNDYIILSLQRKLSELNQLAKNLITNSLSFQERYILLRKCFSLKVNHLFRTIPPNLTEDFKNQFKTILKNSLSSMLSLDNSPPHLCPLRINQIFLKLEDGGFGLPDFDSIQHAAFISSLIQCSDSIFSHVLSTAQPPNTVDIINFMENNKNSNSVLKEFFNSLQKFSEFTEINIANLRSRDQSNLQSSLSDKLYSVNLKQFKESLFKCKNSNLIANFQTQIGEDSAAWLNAIPKHQGYTLSNSKFNIALLRRFYLPLPCIEAGSFCNCHNKPPLDREGRHLTHGCAKGGHMFQTSNAIEETLQYISKYSYIRSIAQDKLAFRITNSQNNERPDLTLLNVPNIPQEKTLIDIAITQSFPGSQNPLSSNITSIRKYTHISDEYRKAEERAKGKIDKYSQLSEQNGHHFIPFIIETNGHIHRIAKDLLLNLAKRAAQHRDISYNTIYKYFITLLSISLQDSLSSAVLRHCETIFNAYHDKSNYIPDNILYLDLLS